MTSFSVPGDPQGWQRVRSGNGVFYTASETRTYQTSICWFAKAHHLEMIEGPVTLRLVAHYRIPASATKKRRAAMLAGADLPTKKPDLDNVVKNFLDALNGVAWVDDAQVVVVSASKRWSDEPRVEVQVTATEVAKAEAA